MARKKSKSKASSSQPVPCCGTSKAEQEKYLVEDATRSLKRAQEVQTDKALMGKCKKKLKQEQVDIGKIMRKMR